MTARAVTTAAEARVYFDGGYRPKRDAAAWAVLAFTPTGTIVRTGDVTPASSAAAERAALKHAKRLARHLAKRYGPVTVIGDDEGILKLEVDTPGVRFEWTPRELNRADWWTRMHLLEPA